MTEIINSGPINMAIPGKTLIHTVDQDCLLPMFNIFVNSYDKVEGFPIISIGSNYPYYDNLVKAVSLQKLIEVQDYMTLVDHGERKKEVVGGDEIYLNVLAPITAGQMEITAFGSGFTI